LFGFILIANGCQSARELENTTQDFDYTEADGEVKLTLTNGEVVRMRFGENAVKIYESHLYKSDVYEITAFIYAYGEENGSEVPRKEREIAGELKLHNLLYTVGYERGRTKDADVEYTADKRWYVNLASVVLG
jgi:hypothetical protein